MHSNNTFGLGSQNDAIRSSSFGDLSNPNAYRPELGAPPPKKSNSVLWILAIVGGILVLTCGCCGVFGYFAFNAGMDIVVNELRPKMESDPVIQEHIGEIETFTGDFAAGIQESENSGKNGTLVFNIKGSKGEGVVIGKIAPDGTGLEDGRLRMNTGEEFPLTE